MKEKVESKKIFAKDLCFDKLTWIFLICCVLGYAVEEIWCLIKLGHFESRQALVYGPLSVVYGMGAIVLTLALYKIRNSKWYVIFFVSFAVGTVTEYIASLGQEIVFGSVAWDYSNVPLNINGRVCLIYSLFWGVLGLIWIKYLYPVMSNMVEKIPINIGKMLTTAFVIFFVFDCVLSASAAIRMDNRDAGIPATNIVEEYLDEHFTDDRMHEIYANSKTV
jgi:uncharacterized membrane protein